MAGSRNCPLVVEKIAMIAEADMADHWLRIADTVDTALSKKGSTDRIAVQTESTVAGNSNSETEVVNRVLAAEAYMNIVPQQALERRIGEQTLLVVSSILKDWKQN